MYRSSSSGYSAQSSSSMSAAISGSSSRMSRSMTMVGVAPGVSCQIAHSGVKNIVAGRTREKSDMQELNSRFASYIEKVRLLESQNTQLVQSLCTARETSGLEVQNIKTTYENELRMLRNSLDDSDRRKAEIEVRITSLEDRIADMDILIVEYREQDCVDQETITRMNHMVCEYEAEINMLRGRVVKFDEERARDIAEINRLKNDIDHLRTDLDTETLIHIQTEGETQTLREELEFTKQVYEAELKELTNIAYRDTTVEVRDFWKGELAQAIQDLRMEYDSRIEFSKIELDTIYTAKVEEYTTQTTTTSFEVVQVREESERVKIELTTLRETLPRLEERHTFLEKEISEISVQIEDIRRTHEIERVNITKEVSEVRYELAVVLEELQTLLDAKLSLELEIAAYRKLLEYEESRLTVATCQGGISGGGSSSIRYGGSSGGGYSSSSSRGYGRSVTGGTMMASSRSAAGGSSASMSASMSSSSSSRILRR